MTTHPNLPLRSEETSSFNWQLLWMIIAPRLGLFFVCLLVFLLATIAYLLKAPRLYESTGTVQVELQEQRAFKSTDSDAGPIDDLKADEVVKTIEQNLQNYALMLKVVSDPKIANDPDFLVGYPKSATPPSTSNLATWLKTHTFVSLRHGTRLIDISVDHEVPAMAQKLVQAVITSFSSMNGDEQNSTEQAALEFLMKQSDDVKASLQKSENSLAIYKDTLLLKDRIDTQQRVIDGLRQKYREKHPQLIQARALMAALLKTFDSDFKKDLQYSPNEAAYWASNSDALAAAPAAPADDRILTEIKLVEARTDVLQKQVDTESALFDNVLKQMRETNVIRDATPTEIRMIQEPPLPEKPSKPKKALILALGSAAGCLAGLAAMAVSFAVDSSIQSPAEAEALLKLPLLGVIPRASSGRKTRLPAFLSSFASKKVPPPDPAFNELILVSDPASAAAEGFRSLRAVMALLGSADRHRTILFTSALPSEGKTFVSCNYALALAQAGLKTLLVDTDLRRPSVHTRFKLGNKVGFTEVITENLHLNEAVHFQVAKNLDVLCAGGKCPNPAELLTGPGFKDTLAKALASYDRIVFDCSPVNLVSDSLLIAGFVDTICLVVRADSTPRQASVHAVGLFRRIQKEPSGFVLNALPPRNDRAHLGYQSQDDGSYRQNYA